MSLALKDAALSPDQVDYINAHGTSTPAGDVAELEAVKAVFGDHARHLMMSSTKSMTGHMLGAAGAIELIASAMAIRDGIVPPTINLDQADPAAQGMDLVPHVAREHPIKVALSNSFGFGGTNGSIVISKFK